MNSGFIVIIVICVWIYNLISKTKSGTKEKDGENGRKTPDSYPSRAGRNDSYGKPISSAHAVGSGHGAMPSGPVQAQTTAVKAATVSGHAKKTGAVGPKGGKSASKPEEVSTTEYLRQKAMEDQKEHEREARQEEARLRQESGRRRAAVRHYDGDSIPSGMRMVKCGYCGAENLVGNGQNQKDFTCYFCRERL